MSDWQVSEQEDDLMIVYPVPAEVTQARIQLLVDQTAKAPPNTINEDLKAVYDAKSQAQQAQFEKHAERHAEPSAQVEPTGLIDVKV